MPEALSRGDRIEIRGFGSFKLNIRTPRTARNRKKGEKVIVCRIKDILTDKNY